MMNSCIYKNYINQNQLNIQTQCLTYINDHTIYKLIRPKSSPSVDLDFTVLTSRSGGKNREGGLQNKARPGVVAVKPLRCDNQLDVFL